MFKTYHRLNSNQKVIGWKCQALTEHRWDRIKTHRIRKPRHQVKTNTNENVKHWPNSDGTESKLTASVSHAWLWLRMWSCWWWGTHSVCYWKRIFFKYFGYQATCIESLTIKPFSSKRFFPFLSLCPSFCFQGHCQFSSRSFSGASSHFVFCCRRR